MVMRLRVPGAKIDGFGLPAVLWHLDPALCHDCPNALTNLCCSAACVCIRGTTMRMAAPLLPVTYESATHILLGPLSLAYLIHDPSTCMRMALGPYHKDPNKYFLMTSDLHYGNLQTCLATAPASSILCQSLPQVWHAMGQASLCTEVKTGVAEIVLKWNMGPHLAVPIIIRVSPSIITRLGSSSLCDVPCAR